MARIVLIEDKPYKEPIPSLAIRLGIEPYDLMSCLSAADAYLCKRLSLNGSLHIERNRFSFERVAGIFPVCDQLEIEVVPKFMDGNEAWRADFLLLLARTKWGLLAERQMISTTRSKDRGISDALAMVFLSMFDSVSHVPIRTYRRKQIRQFEIEGDLFEESVVLPERDGFLQDVTEFTRQNIYNAVIVEVTRLLINSVTDFDLKSRLIRVATQLGGQSRLDAAPPRSVPSRFRGWQDLYSLCIDILDGYGIDYISQGEMLSPGFVVRTSDAWEEFLRQTLVAGLKDCRVAFQEKHPFARRDAAVMKVRPDYILRTPDGHALLVDAKYKSHDASVGTISNSDVYEGRAFMEATGIQRLVLLYPYGSPVGGGHFAEFQHVRDDGWDIYGVRVHPGLIASGGLSVFGEEIGQFMRGYLKDSVAQ